MENKYKAGEGFCTIALSEYGDPLIIYPIDKEGNPIIEENEMVILKIGRIYEENGIRRAKVGIFGKSYHFIRGELLRNYDKERCRLSKENFDKLKGILDKKMKEFAQKHKPLNSRLEEKIKA